MPVFSHYNVTTTDIVTLSAVETVDSNSAAQNIKGPPTSITICNFDHSGDDCKVEVFIASQVGSDITDTGTDSNEADNAITTSSLTLTVDGTAATTDVFTNEPVFKSDGTLIGTCTARNSNTEIVFGNGISQILENNTSLFTGTRYRLIHDVMIPGGCTLVLQEEELSYDSTVYALKFKLLDVSTSQRVDIKVTY
jgi:hypothetical protein